MDYQIIHLCTLHPSLAYPRGGGGGGKKKIIIIFFLNIYYNKIITANGRG